MDVVETLSFTLFWWFDSTLILLFSSLVKEGLQEGSGAVDGGIIRGTWYVVRSYCRTFPFLNISKKSSCVPKPNRTPYTVSIRIVPVL